ncbi:hypothetical protein MNB_SV-13-1746 [hydrothermal vent metagenome]|uniref:MOSC domain-containing protein n=1 Tax=hydrothermal vent metagenome TaxID=652676 RepID=A0A1W1CI20_9ZZZZ
MTKVGIVSSLFYSPPSGRKNSHFFHLDSQGICDDKHYNKNIARSVLIASLDSYTLSKNHGIELNEGFLGENILMDYNPYHLGAGSQLRIGNTVLEINQLCTLCKSLSQIDTRLPKLLKNDRGIFAKVIHSGMIEEGDSIYLLD